MLKGLFVTHFISKKGNEIYALCFGLGYANKFLCVRAADIAEMADMSPSKFCASVPLDTEIPCQVIDGILVLEN